jgi:hypothetical protein
MSFSLKGGTKMANDKVSDVAAHISEAILEVVDSKLEELSADDISGLDDEIEAKVKEEVEEQLNDWDVDDKIEQYFSNNDAEVDADNVKGLDDYITNHVEGMVLEVDAANVTDLDDFIIDLIENRKGSGAAIDVEALLASPAFQQALDKKLHDVLPSLLVQMMFHHNK